MACAPIVISFCLFLNINMFARRTLAVASRTALSASKQVAAARGFHTATNAESAATKYLTLGGATLLTAYGMYTFQSSHVVSAAEKKQKEEKTSDKQSSDKQTSSDLPLHGNAGTNQERTFIAIKPDGVHRGLIAEVIARFERKGYKLVAIKVVQPTKEFAAQHYDDLKDKPFFKGLITYFSSGPVVAMVWEGKGVIKGGRRLVGATDPNAAEDGSLRGDFCIEVGRNIVHGSDAPDAAEAEINLWFKEGEVTSYSKTIEPWVYGK